MKRLIFKLILCITLANAMEMPHPVIVDANGYHYRNESDVQDKRNIAIISYGSLVNQPQNLITHVRLEATQFQPTTIQLPVSLMRESSSNTPQRRITAIIDRTGELKRVWAATSTFHYLPNARNNLAAREGSRLQSQATGYDLNNIFYMKKLLPGRTKDNNEEVIPQTDRWVIRVASHELQKLPTNIAQSIARWADNNTITAVIWASFPPNIASKHEVIQRLIADQILLHNTQAYVRNLPDGAQSSFEREIISGREAILGTQEQPTVRQPTQPTQPVSQHMEYHNFTYFQTGNLPILISAPHGGVKSIGIRPRIGGINPLTGRHINLFVTVWDDGTLELAKEINNQIYQLLGKKPYFVAADFTRKEIDANRPPEDAYENATAAPVYNQYHEKLREYINEMRNKFGDKTLLIDIHGQGVSADTIYRGTSNRRTVKRLITRTGEAGFTGSNSMLGILDLKGYTIFPADNQLHTNEESMFSGGYIVRNYGSNNSNGIDAIQLESGWKLRRGQGLYNFARDLAEALIGFYHNYLE